MIAYVILRPDGTIVDRSFSTMSEGSAWVRAARGYSVRGLKDAGFQPLSFEVPLPAPKEKQTEHP